MAKKNVWVCLGDIFEGGAHLTVLPASAKGTISSSCRRWVTLFNLVAPPFDKKAVLGELSDIFTFPNPTVSAHYCYAYSVFNDRSTSEALTEIGRALGRITQEDSNIQIIQSPLLGTGAGGLSNDDAAKALIAGFVEASHPNALLCIFVSDSERQKNLQKHLESVFSQVLDGISMEVSYMGVGFDIKKALKAFLDALK